MLNQAERNAAAEINARLQRVVEEIRTYTGVTDRERKRMIAAATITARDALRKLREDSTANEASARGKAYLAVFGLDAVRGAEERALRAAVSQENPDAVEIDKRLRAALRIGDMLAAKVYASAAFDHRNDEMGGEFYRGILDTYANQSPGLLRQMKELAATDTAIGDSGAARLERFSDKLMTEIAIAPEVADGSLEAWAAPDSDPAPSQGMPFGLGNTA